MVWAILFIHHSSNNTQSHHLNTRSLKLSARDGSGPTVDGNQKSGEKTTWDGSKNLVNNGINYQPQLVIAGFLNHQQ